MVHHQKAQRPGTDEKAMSWQATATRFLEAAYDALPGLDRRWSDMASLPPSALVESSDGWLVLDWALRPHHRLWLAVGRKQGADVSVVWGFASCLARRDPVFFATCAGIGATIPGQAVEVRRRRYVFCPGAHLSLETDEPVRLDELDAPDTERRVLTGMTALLQAITTLRAPAEAAGISPSDRTPARMVAQQALCSVPASPLQGTAAGTATEREAARVLEFQRRVLSRISKAPLPLASGKVRPEWSVCAHGGKLAHLRLRVERARHYFLAVGPIKGHRISISWGYASDLPRRDPAFRELFRSWKLLRPGDKCRVGLVTYTYCLWDQLNVGTELLVSINELNMNWCVDDCVAGLQQIVEAVASQSRPRRQDRRRHAAA
jgi:hypothetical protein